jgi:WD40 repeat protein
VAASAGEDGRVLLWHADSAELLAELAEESSWIEQLAWSSDGRTLAAAAEKTIHLWRDGESLGVWFDARRRVLAMAWAPDGERLATAANKGLYLWRIGGQEPAQLLEFPGAPVAVAWDTPGRALAVGTQDGFLQIWLQGRSGPARRLTMRGYPGKVSCLAWHPRRAVIASAGGRDLVLWPTEGEAAGRKAQPLRAHEHTVTALGYAPDASLLVSGDRGGRLCVWDDAGVLQQLAELGDEITVLAWSADGRLACGTTAGRLQVYAMPVSGT